MISSMTGFGLGQVCSDGISLTVECKSVNNRYLDFSFRLPKILRQKELMLKEQVQSKVERGSFSLQVTVDADKTGQTEYAVDHDAAKGYKKLLEELREVAEIEEPVTIKDLMEFEAIFVSPPQEKKTIDLIWHLTQQATDDALFQLNTMRRQEGKQLQQDLYDRIEHIEQMMKSIQEITKNRAEQVRQQLLERINNLMEETKLDEERLEMEVAILVDKIDITEEIVRLQSHIKFFKEALEAENTVGRRLKFLCQEMNREVNTMGSKSNHARISQLVVQSKESLEQIREQVLNIE